jgi:hypothetical protein
MYTSCPTSHCVAVASVQKIASDSLDPQIPSSTALDCDDYNLNVFPGQTAYFTSTISDSGGTSSKNGTFDYNCNGTITIKPAQNNDSYTCMIGQDPIGGTFGPGSILRNDGFCLTNIQSSTWCDAPQLVSTSNCGQLVGLFGTFYTSTSSCSGSAFSNYTFQNITERLQCN